MDLICRDGGFIGGLVSCLLASLVFCVCCFLSFVAAGLDLLIFWLLPPSEWSSCMSIIGKKIKKVN